MSSVTVPPFPLKDWLQIGELRTIEIGMQQVQRWGHYRKQCPTLPHRIQNDLQHTLSISLRGRNAIAVFQRHYDLDAQLLMDAFMVHDLGEIQHGDTAVSHKTEQKDLAEYLSFRKMCLNWPAFDDLHRAYLLQHAFNNPPSFPVEARGLMTVLARTREVEARIFNAVELLDYIGHALEIQQWYDNASYLAKTLRGTIPKLNGHLRRLRGLEEIYPKPVQKWLQTFAAAYEYLFPEDAPYPVPPPVKGSARRDRRTGAPIRSRLSTPKKLRT